MFSSIFHLITGGWAVGLLLTGLDAKGLQIIEEDYYSNSKGRGHFSIINVTKTLRYRPSYRNVLCYRVNNYPNRPRMIFCKYVLFNIFFPTLTTIEITGDIAGGIRVNHNYAVISPQRAGRNLIVQQGAVIGGDKKTKENVKPVLGNDVFVGANAVILGNIFIGDNVRIGALSFVNCNVPDNSTVVGNPCRIISR